MNWQTYKEGVFDNCKQQLNFAATLVGIRNGDWIVKNDWGTSWGEKGYIRLAGGKSTCGICNMASYPNKWSHSNKYLLWIHNISINQWKESNSSFSPCFLQPSQSSTTHSKSPKRQNSKSGKSSTLSNIPHKSKMPTDKKYSSIIWLKSNNTMLKKIVLTKWDSINFQHSLSKNSHKLISLYNLNTQQLLKNHKNMNL